MLWQTVASSPFPTTSRFRNKALDNGYKSYDSLESKEKNRGFVRLNYGASQMNKKLEFFSSMAVAFIVLILVFLCIRFSGQGKFATHGGTNPSDVKYIYTSVGRIMNTLGLFVSRKVER